MHKQQHTPTIGLIGLLQCCLLAAVCWLVAAIESPHQHETNNNNDELPTAQKRNWEPIHYKIYATSGFRLSIDETAKLLGQLNEIYADQSDSDTNGRKTRVANLLLASQLDQDDCGRVVFDMFKNLIEYNSPYQLNVISYLRYYQDAQLKVCTDNAHKRLGKAVAKLSNSQLSDLEQLVNSIAFTPLNYHQLGTVTLRRELPFKYLINGLLAYLEIKLGGPLDVNEFAHRRNGKLRVLEQLAEHVFGVCEACLEAMDPFLALVEMGKLDHNTMDHNEQTWLLYGNVCKSIKLRSDAVHKKIYETVRDSQKTKDKIKNVLNNNKLTYELNTFGKRVKKGAKSVINKGGCCRSRRVD